MSAKKINMALVGLGFVDFCLRTLSVGPEHEA